MNPEGRSAIVTGGAGGLGAATVRHLAAIGMHTVVVDIDGDRTNGVANEVLAATAVVGDTNDDDTVATASDAATRAGALSLVVNLAGGGVRPTRTVGRDDAPHAQEQFVETMRRNAFGTFNVTRLAAAVMARNEPDGDGERGAVVNTGSVAGLEGQAGQVAYAAAKGAILGMTLPLARDLAPIGIRVCAIAPGVMGTPVMLGANEELKSRLLAGVQFPHRMGRPDEFAQLVETILRNPYLNGENIRLDAALRLSPR